MKVSEGCLNCYAVNMSNRLSSMGIPMYKGTVRKGKHGLYWSGRIKIPGTTKKEYIKILRKPFQWKTPRMVFVASMSDLFQNEVPFEYIKEIIDVIRHCPQHIFILCTKRPAIMREFFNDWLPKQQMYVKLKNGGIVALPYVIPQNLWLLTSTETQKRADERIPELLRIQHIVVRGISVEPMLEEIDLTDSDLSFCKSIWNIDWVIVGCESGPSRRECKIEWVRSIVEQCKNAGVPVYVKQLEINGKVTSDITQFPKELRIRQFPLQHEQEKIYRR